MAQLAGAAVGTPLVRDLSANLPMISTLGIDPKLRTAVVAYGLAEFTKGQLSDAAFGAALGALGAWSYAGDGLLGDLFGGS